MTTYKDLLSKLQHNLQRFFKSRNKLGPLNYKNEHNCKKGRFLGSGKFIGKFEGAVCYTSEWRYPECNPSLNYEEHWEGEGSLDF